MKVPRPVNEPVLPYGEGDPRKASVKSQLNTMASQRVEIPLIIGGQEIRTGNKRRVVMPHSHQEVLAEFHLAGPDELQLAAKTAVQAQRDWESMRWEDRTAIFLKASELLVGPYRDILNASTMLGQSKNIFQAEIDASCELIDFFRFNAHFYQQILETQPISSPGVWNRSEYRPLEGFVFAITPFNFTSIAANLAAAPAMMGNVVVWKPSDTQMLSAYYSVKLLEEAGLPPGVINLVGADGPMSGETLLPHPDLAGVHFTGSTATFRKIYQSVGSNIDKYRAYPRIVGETGGKDFVFAHESADVEALTAALIRGAFEYQGQKCSAASRAYIPKSVWSRLRDPLLSEIKKIRMGDVRDFTNFVNAVIDERAFKKISGYLDAAAKASDAEILVGGGTDDSTGYFVEPTVIQTTNPRFKTMVEEIFGPVLTVFVYDENRMEETLDLCNTASPYALTGAVFSQDRQQAVHISNRLRHAAGNFYFNDKPTGAVVGQQPFGGGRASGTNDKAGSIWNLIRWLSPRSLKETLDPPKDYRYPFMDEA